MNDIQKNPYVGPRTFLKEEGHLFFGREREAQDLTALVASDKLVLFYAQSGAGKSSLINTRLHPYLETKQYEVLPIARVSGNYPEAANTRNTYVYDLMRSLSQHDSSVDTLGNLSLSEFLARLNEDENGYFYDASLSPESPEGEGLIPVRRALIIDQFEELFSTHPEAWNQREDFFIQLAQAMEEDPYLWVVLVMREDYIAALDPYAHLLLSGLRTRYYMQRLSWEAAIAAVKKPVENMHPYEPGVAEKLVNDLSSIKIRKPDNTLEMQAGQYVEPVQLQVVCSSLWEKLPDNLTEITQEYLDQYVGDVNQALGNYYEERVKAVAEGDLARTKGVKERDIRDWFGWKLITADGIRNMVAQDRGGQSGGLDDDIVQEFVKQGDLVRAENRGGATFYELTHDRLVEPIIKNNKLWSAKNVGLLQQQTALWVQQGRSSGLLIHGSDLRKAKKEAETLQLTKDERAFLTASTVSQRNRMILFICTIIILGAMGVLSYTAFEQSKLAIKNERAARAQEVVARQKAEEAERSVEEAIQERRSAEQAKKEAEEARRLAEINELAAEAQRSAARAQIHQTRPGGLYTSTLLAIDSMLRQPSDLAEEILRKNITLLPLPITQNFQRGKINALALSPQENNIVATASADGTVCAWEVEGGDQIFCTRSGQSSVNTVAFSPDGSYLVTGDQAGLIRIIDPQNGETLHVFQRFGSPSALAQIVDTNSVSPSNRDQLLNIPIRGVIFRPPRGEQIAVAYADGHIPVFNINTLKISAPLWTGSSPLVTAFSPDGKWLAAGSEDGRVIVFDLSSPSFVSSSEHKGGVLAIAFSPDRRTIATGGKDDTASILNLRTGSPLKQLPTENWVRDIAYSPDGSWLVTVSDDHRIRIWDTATGRERFVMSQEGVVTDVAISSNSRWIATTGADRTARLWNAETGTEIFQIPLSASGSVLSFSRDDRHLVVTDDNGAVTIWDISVIDAPESSIHFNGVVNNVQYSPSGEQLAVSEGNVVWLFNSEQLSDLKDHIQGKPLLQFTSNVEKLVFSPNSKYIGILTEGNEVAFYNIKDRNLYKLEVPNLVPSIAFSPDSQQFIASDFYGTLKAWDVTNSQSTELLSKEFTQGVSLATSSEFLAIGSTNTIDILGADNNGGVPALTSFGENLLLALNKEGSLLASADASGRIHIWEYQEGVFVETPSFVREQADSMAFNPQGTLLAVGTARDVFLMDLESGEEMARVAHPDRVSALSFSEDGNTLVTASARTLQLWDIQKIHALRLGDLIEAACSRLIANFSHDQWRVLFGDQDYRVLCPNLPIPE